MPRSRHVSCTMYNQQITASAAVLSVLRLSSHRREELRRDDAVTNQTFALRITFSMQSREGPQYDSRHQCSIKECYRREVQSPTFQKRDLGRPLWTKAALQLNFHVERARVWIGTIRGDFLESESAVHRHRVFHDGFDCVEAHAPVSDPARVRDDAVGEDPS